MRKRFLSAAVWVAAAAVLSAAAPAEPARPATGQPPEHFPMYLSADRALVMLRIGMQPPIPVVFDTGASGNVVDQALADRIGLPDIGPSDGRDGQGMPVPGHKTRLSGASVGGVRVPETTALAAAYNLPDEVGILSPESFSGRLVRIDLAHGRVTLPGRTQADTPRCPAFAYSHDFSFDDKDKTDTLPTAEMELAGRRITAEIDTGDNSDLILPTSYIPQLPLEAKPVIVGYGQSQVGREVFLEGRLTVDVTIAGVVLKRPSVLFAAKHKPNIGLGVLRRFTVVLDPAAQRDWLIPADMDPVTCLPRTPSLTAAAGDLGRSHGS